jgi:hypothetical protein
MPDKQLKKSDPTAGADPAAQPPEPKRRKRRATAKSETAMAGPETSEAPGVEDGFDPYDPGLSDAIVAAHEQSAAATARLVTEAATHSEGRTQGIELHLDMLDKRLDAAKQRSAEIAKEWDAWMIQAGKWLTNTERRLKEASNPVPLWERLLPGAAISLVVALLTLGALTWLRPGWTMTSEQREALRIGEGIARHYLQASPARQAEMRRMNGWREPLSEGPAMEPPPGRTNR